MARGTTEKLLKGCGIKMLHQLRCLCALAILSHFAFGQDPSILLQVPLSPLGNLTLAREGAALLESLEGPVALVGIAGPYRTGKSFLLNQLKHASKGKDSMGPSTVSLDAAGESGESSRASDFPVGDTVWPVTASLAIQYLGKSQDGTSIFAFGAFLALSSRAVRLFSSTLADACCLVQCVPGASPNFLYNCHAVHRVRCVLCVERCL